MTKKTEIWKNLNVLPLKLKEMIILEDDTGRNQNQQLTQSEADPEDDPSPMAVLQTSQIFFGEKLIYKIHYKTNLCRVQKGKSAVITKDDL